MIPMATNGGMASPFFPANFLLQMQQPLPHLHHHHHHHEQHQQQHEHELAAEHHHLLPPPPPSLATFLHQQDLPMLPSGNNGGGVKRSMYDDDDEQHQQQQQEEAGSDDEGVGCGGGGGEKKRRLGVEQVRTLEKNFELGNKLEPERKAQLARALGLQPRQVAIWFQNRRARWKTKQLEKDYDVLRRQLDAARADNDALLSLNNKLQAEIVALKGGGGGGSGGSSCRQQEAASELINLNVKEAAPEASCSNDRSENSSEINLGVSRAPPAEISFYAAVGRTTAGADIDQLLHNNSPSAAVPSPKMELGTGNFGSLLCGAVDEPPPFWPWADGGHHHFH